MAWEVCSFWFRPSPDEILTAAAYQLDQRRSCMASRNSVSRQRNTLHATHMLMQSRLHQCVGCTWGMQSSKHMRHAQRCTHLVPVSSSS